VWEFTLGQMAKSTMANGPMVSSTVSQFSLTALVKVGKACGKQVIELNGLPKYKNE